MDAQETSRPIDLSKIAPTSEPQTTGVEERLTALEKKMPSRGETWFLRFGAIAGVLGTLISIAAAVDCGAQRVGEGWWRSWVAYRGWFGEQYQRHSRDSFGLC
jgi:hypothetical protein